MFKSEKFLVWSEFNYLDKTNDHRVAREENRVAIRQEAQIEPPGRQLWRHDHHIQLHDTARADEVLVNELMVVCDGRLQNPDQTETSITSVLSHERGPSQDV